MPHDQHYDYIIAGGGAAGLTLTNKFCSSDFDNKKILLVDSHLKPKNSKTWCFWATSDLGLGSKICKKWNYLEARTGKELKHFSLEKYSYYAIQSRVLSSVILDKCKAATHINLLEGSIDKMTGASSDTSSSDKATIVVNGDSYTADWIFQSCFSKTKKAPKYSLSQHFVGWDVETDRDVFDIDKVTLMDFDFQFDRQGVAFMYMLPWSKKSALLEYTIFSPGLEPDYFYEEKIKAYLKDRYQLTMADYTIKRKEQGAIPMEDRTYEPLYANKILSIGFAGGISKPSTGYTFKNIQIQIDHIIDDLLRGKTPRLPKKHAFRFRCYDLLLLNILYSHPADEVISIFTELFKHNDIDLVLKFLDNQTSIFEDLAIMYSVPYWPFIKSIFRNFKELMRGGY